MKSKRQEILEELEAEFHRWEEQLSRLRIDEITTSRLPNGWSIKDLMAHLMAWQQVTTARLEAARRDESPVLPEWLAGADPESDEELHRFNARIFEFHRERPWPQVHQEWRTGFLKVLNLGKELPEEDLVEKGRYPWLNGYPLLAVLEGTYEHHHEDHLGSLLAWINGQRGDGSQEPKR